MPDNLFTKKDLKDIEDELKSVHQSLKKDLADIKKQLDSEDLERHT